MHGQLQYVTACMHKFELDKLIRGPGWHPEARSYLLRSTRPSHHGTPQERKKNTQVPIRISVSGEERIPPRNREQPHSLLSEGPCHAVSSYHATSHFPDPTSAGWRYLLAVEPRPFMRPTLVTGTGPSSLGAVGVDVGCAAHWLGNRGVELLPIGTWK